MVSWDAEPDPPEIIGPWFLCKLLIDEGFQGPGYGAEVVRQVAELVPGGPAGFYERLGFVPIGDVDGNGEVIMRLALPQRRGQPGAQAIPEALSGLYPGVRNSSWSWRRRMPVLLPSMTG